MKTIARNRIRLIHNIFHSATHCLVFSLNNGFRGAECSPFFALKEFEQFRFAKLQENGSGSFTVKIHSNLWYEIKAPATTA